MLLGRAIQHHRKTPKGVNNDGVGGGSETSLHVDA